MGNLSLRTRAARGMGWVTAGAVPASLLVLSLFAETQATKAGTPAAAPRMAKSAEGVKPVAAHAEAQPAGVVKVRLLPSTVALSGPENKQRVLVQAVFADGHEEDVSATAKFTSSAPGVAAVDAEGFVTPAGDGKATVRAAYRGLQASVPVEVAGTRAPFAWSFRNHVLPVMTKAGCNSGACHGAAAGKNGFKLTLRGYDPEADYYSLTRQSLSRRTVKLEPAKSLVLLKPTLAVAHGGGQRFEVGSPDYRVIAEWIAAGMPPPKESDPRIQELQVLPREVSLAPGAKQQLLVQARFSDGHVEDVTPWAKYTSGDEGVASVNDQGLVSMRGSGEAPVTVWYLSRVTFARLNVPFPNQVREDVFRKAPRKNYIDDLVLKKLRALHIPPSRPATDAEFVRRAYLGAAGILPTAAEAEKFLADRSPDKRARLIDALLEREEFVDYWAYKWSDVLLVSSKKLSRSAMWSYYDWIRRSVASNKPWDRFVRDIVTSTGNSLENPAANYFVIHREPIDISENMTQAFLGMSITCARCHNHPLEKWTQADYYGLANVFARVRLKTGGGALSRTALDDVTVFSSPMGEVNHPRLGRPLAPRPLDSDPLPLDSPEDRREYFARWLTSSENPYFARALVNRVWANFMGRGLVEAVDDLRMTNPPSNQDLLDALVKDFVDHGFDVRHLIRTIMSSAAYQTGAEPTPENAADEKYYSHYLIRRLPAEVLLDALSQVTQVPEKFAGYPDGMRALELPDTQVESYFLAVFGRPPRLQTRESERQSDPSITQALHVINGETLNTKLRAPGGTVEMLLKLGLSEERIVEYLYLAAVSRYPTEEERRALVSDLASARAKKSSGGGGRDPRREGLEDMMWAMLTSKEFLFNH